MVENKSEIDKMIADLEGLIKELKSVIKDEADSIIVEMHQGRLNHLKEFRGDLQDGVYALEDKVCKDEYS